MNKNSSKGGGLTALTAVIFVAFVVVVYVAGHNSGQAAVVSRYATAEQIAGETAAQRLNSRPGVPWGAVGLVGFQALVGFMVARVFWLRAKAEQVKQARLAAKDSRRAGPSPASGLLQSGIPHLNGRPYDQSQGDQYKIF